MSLSKFHLSQMLVVAISKLLAKLLAGYLTALSRRIGRVNLFIYSAQTCLLSIVRNSSVGLRLGLFSTVLSYEAQ